MEPVDTKYRVGDYVIYEYIGTYVKEPVFLTEKIIRQNGNRLTIQVEAHRGKEKREWIQIVNDTKENRENNVVDELYEIVNSQNIYLSNKNNQDVLRLYEWVLPPSGEKISKLEKTTVKIQIPGIDFLKAECTKHLQKIEIRKVEVTHCTSQEFLWTQVSSHMQDTATGEILYQMRVCNWGRNQD